MSSQTIPVRKGEELDLPAIEAYLRSQFKNLPDQALTIKQFSAGRSNLTYQLNMGDGWEAVLRRPPLGPVAPKAHDMEREFKILQEIHPYFPQAPEPYLFADERVIGSPFIIMERKHGVVLDTKFPEGVEVTDQLCKDISEIMVDSLVSLHSIDFTKTKLKEMTKPDGFMERQVHGWIKRYERSQTDDISGISSLKNWLVNHLPKSQKPTIIHYDYKLNNAMFHDDLSGMNGLFDWEMTTVGDPLADLGVAMSYWIEADDSDLLKRGLGEEPITTLPGFMTRDEFLEAYARKSGRDLSEINFYMTFAYFKLAVICQQIYYRWKKGQTQDDRFAELNHFVDNLIQYAVYNAEK
ncbi:Predicted kinase, aminoglycoside phosphotransferase (APT) family [Thalassobacillus cyri]|uniref:Predicted kinase, aminoglycoside phosphotransferase (APT) family n=1 Tax=Thalassobacillus cyri TaxID=571932 RepID=A0A1H4GYZ0_9BACI|nr:phosphotransferase family protein [Thalassobacillus cyri]SEB14819.1 Predicted kinase, aminoglycoside phosphotransferase (APT) family [Thalassobacillus cyri]